MKTSNQFLNQCPDFDNKGTTVYWSAKEENTNFEPPDRFRELIFSLYHISELLVLLFMGLSSPIFQYFFSFSSGL